MKKLYSILLFISAFGISNAQTIPTWADNVACILYTRCTSCHNPNGIAPVPFMTYPEAAAYALPIQNKVLNHVMPPWPPDRNFQTYAHERVLSQQEIDIIDQWVTNGAPQGNIANAPTPPVYASNAVITNPDVSVVMPTYSVPIQTNDLYRCFVMPSGTTVDKFISGIEVLPGNRNIVHHVLVYQDTTNACLTLDSLDPDPGYTSFGGPGSSSADLIGAWVPGATPYFFPAGMGTKLFNHANIIIQVHYPLGSTGQVDSTRVNLQFSSLPGIRNVRIDPILYHYSPVLTNGPLFIPANTTQTFHEQYQVPIAITLLTAGPHMHLIGKQISTYAVTPNNDTIPFVKIDDWDFHWQGFYSFRKAMKIPALSMLHADALYDNTTNNPNNPNNPPQNVQLGEATTDEMMLVYFYWTPYLPGDENIVVDTVTSVQTFNNCTFAVTGIGESANQQTQMMVYPNPTTPATNQFVIELPGQEKYDITIYNSVGQAVKQLKEIYAYTTVDTKNLERGVYFIKASTNEKSLMKKIVLMH